MSTQRFREMGPASADAAAGPPPPATPSVDAAAQRLLDDLAASGIETPLPPHAPQGAAAIRHPLPVYLERAGYLNTVNIAVVGSPGAGASSLVNALLRGRPADAGGAAAPVGCTTTTLRPAAYPLCGCEAGPPASPARLWDLPGVSADRSHNIEVMCADLGFRYFDVVVVVCARRVTQADLRMVGQLAYWGVPHFVARTKVDIDVKSEVRDYGRSAEEALQKVAESTKRQGAEGAYLISTRQADGCELGSLRFAVLASAKVRRSIRFIRRSNFGFALASSAHQMPQAADAKDDGQVAEDPAAPRCSLCGGREPGLASIGFERSLSTPAEISIGGSADSAPSCADDSPAAFSCSSCGVTICSGCVARLGGAGREKARCPACAVADGLRAPGSRSCCGAWHSFWSLSWWPWLLR